MANSERSFIFNPSTDTSTRTEVSIPPRLASVTLIETTISDAPEEPNDSPEKPEFERQRNPTQLQKVVEFSQGHRDARFESLDLDTTSERLATMFAGSQEAIDAALQETVYSTLRWAYRCYEVDSHDAHRFSASPSGRRFQDYIYLFNVLVAFECEPSRRDLRLFTQAARNASNFLFDVTDGWMAFGQVVIGGPELMDCADIQIMASNRLLPRSWVGGLHEATKSMPIRLGRGIWQKNNRVSIPWNEPEGYRVLIHEWAHYALELLDAYLETDSIYSGDDVHTANVPRRALRSSTLVVVPKICLPVESIMDSLEGTSELVPKQHGKHKQSEWERIIAGMYGPRFPRIKSQPEPIDGALPLQDLPFITRLVTDDTISFNDVNELLLFDVPPYINPEHCWVYILRYDNGTPSRIIAQGTLDARVDQGFRLLGAEQGDDIVLIGDAIGQAGRHEIVQRGHIRDIKPITDQGRVTDQRRDRWQQEDKPNEAIIAWEPCDLNMVIPSIEIIPQTVERYDDPTTKIAVRVSGIPKHQVRITLFPLDQPHSIDLQNGEASQDRVALDGHVLVSWGGSNQMIIVNFSQGGGPPTGSPVGATPMTAGSSEGNLMIFFADRGDYPQNHFSRIRIVTTRVPGMAANVKDAEFGVDAQARSYAFSLSSTEPLPSEYLPTLVLAYDKRAELDDGEPFIYRKQEGQWVRITSYRPANGSYVAAPLNQQTAPDLFKPNSDADTGRAEHYRLFFVPDSSPSQPSTGSTTYPVPQPSTGDTAYS